MLETKARFRDGQAVPNPIIGSLKGFELVSGRSSAGAQPKNGEQSRPEAAGN